MLRVGQAVEAAHESSTSGFRTIQDADLLATATP